MGVTVNLGGCCCQGGSSGSGSSPSLTDVSLPCADDGLTTCHIRGNVTGTVEVGGCGSGCVLTCHTDCDPPGGLSGDQFSDCCDTLTAVTATAGETSITGNFRLAYTSIAGPCAYDEDAGVYICDRGGYDAASGDASGCGADFAVFYDGTEHVACTVTVTVQRQLPNSPIGGPRVTLTLTETLDLIVTPLWVNICCDGFIECLWTAVWRRRSNGATYGGGVCVDGVLAFGDLFAGCEPAATTHGDKVYLGAVQGPGYFASDPTYWQCDATNTLPKTTTDAGCITFSATIDLTADA